MSQRFGDNLVDNVDNFTNNRYTGIPSVAYNEGKEVTVLITFSETGWFGVISDEIGFETMSIVAQAVADYSNEALQPGPVVLGYDTRFLSREYAWAIQRVLTANRIPVLLHKKPIPTAFLSMSVSVYKGSLGIMVTGEDRPARYSGLTFRLPSGSPVTPQWMDTLFQYLYRKYPRSAEDSKNLLQYIDVFPAYCKHMETFLDLDLIKSKNPYVISDSFFGSVGTYFQDLMKRWGINGTHIRTRPNPGFLDCVPQPTERNMNPISRLTTQKRGNIGLLFNGDGSIPGMVSPENQMVSGLEASAVLLDEWIRTKGSNFQIQTELYTPNRALSLLAEYGIKTEPLRKGSLNRDPSILWDHHGLTFGPSIPDRDGILQSLLMLQALCREDLDWVRLTERMQYMTKGSVVEKRTLHLDSPHWEKKQNSLVEMAKTLVSSEVEQWQEEGEDRKLCFQDGSWLGFHHNPGENTLLLICEATGKQKADETLSGFLNWLTDTK